MTFDRNKTSRIAAKYALKRAETILSNMAEERTGFWNSIFGRRWPVNHEPLRSDARNALPEIRRAIEKLEDEERRS